MKQENVTYNQEEKSYWGRTTDIPDVAMRKQGL